MTVDLFKGICYMDVGFLFYFFPQSLIQELAQAQKENSQLISKSQKAEAELKILSKTVHR